MATTFLFDSRHALNSGTPHDCMFTLNKSIDVPSSTIVLDNCIIPNLRYNVNNQNNTLIYKKNGGAETTLTMTPGEYSFSSILNALDTLLSSAFAAVTCTLDTTTDLVTVATNSGDTIQFVTGSTLAEEILGFKLNTFSATSISGSYPIRLDGTTYVDVEVLDFPTNTYSTYGTRAILARIPITSPYGTVVYYVNPHGNNGVQGSVGSFQQIHIRLIDDRGRPFILPANAHVSFTFYVTPLIE